MHDINIYSLQVRVIYQHYEPSLVGGLGLISSLGKEGGRISSQGKEEWEPISSLGKKFNLYLLIKIILHSMKM